MAVHYVTDSNFKSEVLEHKGIVLVDFWAEWCGPCRQLGPIVDQYATDSLGKVKVCKLNVDENPEVPTQFGIRGIPTLILFQDGKHIATKVGLLQKADLASWVEDNA